MRETEFKAKEKKIHKMTRDGLAEKNLAQGTQENISSRIADISFAKETANDTAAGHRAAARTQVSNAKPGKQAKIRNSQTAQYSDGADHFAHATAPQIWGPDNAPSSMRDAGDKPMQKTAPPFVSEKKVIQQPVQDDVSTDSLFAENMEEASDFTKHNHLYRQSQKPSQCLGKKREKNAVQAPSKTLMQKPEKCYLQGRLCFVPGESGETTAKQPQHNTAHAFHFQFHAETKKKLPDMDTLGKRTRSKNPSPSGRLTFKRQDALFHDPKTAQEENNKAAQEESKNTIQKKYIQIVRERNNKCPSDNAAPSSHKLLPDHAPPPNHKLWSDHTSLPKRSILLKDQAAGNQPEDITGIYTDGQQRKHHSFSQKRLEQAERNLHETNQHLEKVQEKLPAHRRIWLEKRYDSETGRVKHRLQFEHEDVSEENPLSPLIPKQAAYALIRTGRKTAIRNFHQKIRETEPNNVGVEASHKTELAAEGIRSYCYHQAKRRKREKSVRNVQRTRKRFFQTEGNYAFQQFLSHNPEINRFSFTRWLQKQKIKRQYAAAAREAKKTAIHTRQTVNTTGQLIRVAFQTISAHRTVFGLVALAALVIVLCGSLFTSCTAMLTGVQSAILSSCYVADDEAINNSELRYTELEANLQQNIHNTKRSFPSYDEYRYNIGEISHSPYELMSYLSAAYDDFTYGQIEAELTRLFHLQYRLTRQVIVEQRTYRDQDGDEHTYNWYVLKTTLSVRPLSEIIAVSLVPGEQTERYQIYLQNGGNRQCFQNPFDFAWENFVTSPYGYRINPSTGAKELHRGVDIRVPSGTTIKATQDGRVIFAGSDGEDGLCVVIEGKDGYQSKYAHCQNLLVHVGQEISSGENIAAVGNTGNAAETYLHLELSHHGEYLNPCYFMDSGSQNTSPTLPDNPGEAMGDGTFAAMLAEAERYLGFPYVWGGSSPSTSFDCSGYVSWVINHSGAGNVGRQTAQGLYNLCTPISKDEMQPGDLIFFTGTYSNANPVTHVGIFVGNDQMLHCGDPISYARIDSQYWLSHYYSGGRLP